MITVHATTAEELAQVAALIHDHWFDLEAVIFVEDRRRVTIPVLRGRIRAKGRRRANEPGRSDRTDAMGVLVVRDVSDLQVRDSAGIRWFDFFGISYDVSERHVSIRSNFPLELIATVTGLSVSVTIDEPLPHR
jgi:hypothetical protein